jgi:hypothetical protein
LCFLHQHWFLSLHSVFLRINCFCFLNYDLWTDVISMFWYQFFHQILSSLCFSSQIVDKWALSSDSCISPITVFVRSLNHFW